MPDNGHPAEDFLAPRLEALLREAAAAGHERTIATAVLLDLLQRDAEAETGDPA